MARLGVLEHEKDCGEGNLAVGRQERRHRHECVRLRRGDAEPCDFVEGRERGAVAAALRENKSRGGRINGCSFAKPRL